MTLPPSQEDIENLIAQNAALAQSLHRLENELFAVLLNSSDIPIAIRETAFDVYKAKIKQNELTNLILESLKIQRQEWSQDRPSAFV